MTEEFILSKIEEIAKKFAGTNAFISVKGLPINLIPETVKSKLIDAEVIVNNLIDDEHFLSKKFRKKLRDKLEDESDNYFFVLYESLLLAKPYENEFFNSKIVIIDFSFSSFVPNNFTAFNYNIADLNESAESFEIGDFNTVIANSVKIGDNYFVQYTDSELLGKYSDVNIVFGEKDWNYQSLDTINETEIKEDQFVFNPEDINFVDWVYSLMNNIPSSVDLLIDNETVKSAFGKEMLGKILFLADAYGFNINLLRIKHDLQRVQRPELFNLLKQYWNSESFRTLKIYADPDISKDLIEISQADVVENIIQQYEFGNIHNTNFQDVFLTAPTGAGKSLLFQMPAIYIGEKYGALSIVVSPLKALMVDQVEQLRNEKGYSKVAYINSDISVIRREEIINQIKDNEIDILYMAPELLQPGVRIILYPFNHHN
jgi:ATP-dependent DNA helicase RecQ